MEQARITVTGDVQLHAIEPRELPADEGVMSPDQLPPRRIAELRRP